MHSRGERQICIDPGGDADRDRLCFGRDVESRADDLELAVAESTLGREIGGRDEQGEGQYAVLDGAVCGASSAHRPTDSLRQARAPRDRPTALSDGPSQLSNVRGSYRAQPIAA